MIISKPIHLPIVVRLGITVGAAWLLFYSINWGVLAGLLVHADPRLLALAVLLAALQFAFLVLRWQAIVELLGGVSVSGTHLTIALGRSLVASQVLPSTVGGDAIRLLAVAGQTGAALAARSVICDRVAGLAVLMGIVVATLPLFASLAGTGTLFMALASISVCSLLLVLFLVAHLYRLSRLPLVGRHTALVGADLRRMFGNGRRTLVVLALSIVIHLVNVLRVYALAQSLMTPISFFQCLVIVPPMLLISAIPISFGGWGVREGALAAGFALVQAGSEAGVATSLLFGLTSLLTGIVANVGGSLARRSEVHGIELRRRRHRSAKLKWKLSTRARSATPRAGISSAGHPPANFATITRERGAPPM